MKTKINFIIYKRIAFVLVLTGLLQNAYTQDSFTSVKINLSNFNLSSDYKNISFDVNFQDIDSLNNIAVPGFVFRMLIPQIDVDDDSLQIAITNPSKELGVAYESITPYKNFFLIKFLNENLITSYQEALHLTGAQPGSRIATVHLSKANGKSFKEPQPFNPTFSGESIKLRTTISIFKEGSIDLELADHAGNALSETTFSGLDDYTLSTSQAINQVDKSSAFAIYPNPADKELHVSVGDRMVKTKLYDISGKLILTQTVNKESTLNISSLPSGAYFVEVSGVKKNFIKK